MLRNLSLTSMIVDTDVLEWGRERARAVPWRGQASVVCLTPLHHRRPPSVEFVTHCLSVLSERGVSDVITSALNPAEANAFLAIGFEERERLRLLSHDLVEIPEAPRPPGVVIRRADHHSRADVLRVDALAFESFWRLDVHGLSDALGATPFSRFRLAMSEGGDVIAYAISGRAGRQGYLQRLAVAPVRRRAGVGLALTVDGLWWLRRRGAVRCVVNTQIGNEAAQALYLRAGFEVEPSELRVLFDRLAR